MGPGVSSPDPADAGDVRTLLLWGAEDGCEWGTNPRLWRKDANPNNPIQSDPELLPQAAGTGHDRGHAAAEDKRFPKHLVIWPILFLGAC